MRGAWWVDSERMWMKVDHQGIPENDWEAFIIDEAGLF